MRRTLGRRVALLAGLVAAVGLRADPGASSSATILQELRSFQTTGSVLYVAAHPDDENNRLLPYFALGLGYRTAYLSLTRGDGGQNLIGPELGEELGVIRTQELLAARRIDGAGQYFSRARDFGFSKDSSDTLRRWDRQEVLSDVVRVIRQFRPDVIVTRFSPIPGGTHGHHTASSILAIEAFREAADPAKFPEQHLPPWQAKRIVWNSFSGYGRARSDSEAAVRLDDGGYDPFLGFSFGEIAAQARSMHRSQGEGRASSRSPSAETFDLLAGEPASGDLMDGIDTTWARIPGGGAMGRQAAALAAQFSPANPSASIPALLEIRRQLALVADSPLVAEKRREADVLLTACLGLFVETAVDHAQVVPGDDLHFHHSVVLRSAFPVRWVGVRIPDGGEHLSLAVTLVAGVPATAEFEKRLPENLPLTQPYWLKTPGSEGMFKVADPELIGRPESPPPIALEQVFEVGGQTLVVPDEPVQIVVDPARGETRRRLEVIAPVSVAWQDPLALFAPGASRKAKVVVTAARAATTGTVHLRLPSGWSAQPESVAIELPAAGERAEAEFTLTASRRLETAPITAVVTVAGKDYDTGRRELAYEHIPPQLLQSPATLRAVCLDLQTKGHAIGYLPGAGDQVADAIARMGYDVSALKPADLEASRLHGYDAVVVGVRAFNTRGDLEAVMPELFRYVEAGGTLIVQYNTFGGLRSTRFAPYPITLSDLRVTHADSAVRLLDPQNAALASPNRIGEDDFAGWIQERARYIPRTWDSHFVPLLSTSDPGEPPLDGTLLIASYGKGRIVYTGLSFFHELPEGVPGAYRLFANLLSLGK